MHSLSMCPVSFPPTNALDSPLISWAIFPSTSWPVPDLFSVCFLRSACLLSDSFYQVSLPPDSGFPCPFDYTISSYSRCEPHAVLPQILFLRSGCSWQASLLNSSGPKNRDKKGEMYRVFSESLILLTGIGAEKMLSDWMVYRIKGEGKMECDRRGIGWGYIGSF